MATQEIGAPNLPDPFGEFADNGVFTSPSIPMNDVGLPASDGGGEGAILIYTMRATQNGSGLVYWENEENPDKLGTGDNAPVGVLTDIGVISKEVR